MVFSSSLILPARLPGTVEVAAENQIICGGDIDVGDDVGQFLQVVQ